MDGNGSQWPSTWQIVSVIGGVSTAEYEASYAQPENEEMDVDTAVEASPAPGPSTINTTRAPVLPATPAVQAIKKENAEDK